MVEFKNNEVRFEDLQVGDTFYFKGKNFLVVDDKDDTLSCFCFEYNHLYNFSANNTLVENAKRDGKEITTEATPKFEKVTMGKLKPGDLFRYVLDDNLYMYIGYNEELNSYSAVDLTGERFEITQFAGYYEYNKLINKDCIKKIYSN